MTPVHSQSITFTGIRLPKKARQALKGFSKGAIKEAKLAGKKAADEFIVEMKLAKASDKAKSKLQEKLASGQIESKRHAATLSKGVIGGGILGGSVGVIKTVIISPLARAIKASDLINKVHQTAAGAASMIKEAKALKGLADISHKCTNAARNNYLMAKEAYNSSFMSGFLNFFGIATKKSKALAEASLQLNNSRQIADKFVKAAVIAGNNTPTAHAMIDGSRYTATYGHYLATSAGTANDVRNLPGILSSIGQGFTTPMGMISGALTLVSTGVDYVMHRKAKKALPDFVEFMKKKGLNEVERYFGLKKFLSPTRKGTFYSSSLYKFFKKNELWNLANK